MAASDLNLPPFPVAGNNRKLHPVFIQRSVGTISILRSAVRGRKSQATLPKEGSFILYGST